MRWLALLLGLAFALTLTLDTSAQQEKKKGRGINGVVAEVKQDEGKETGTITIQVVTGKGKPAEDAEKKTFKVTEDTRIQKASATKGEKPTEAKFADIRKNGRVTIVPKAGEEDVAAVVRIAARGGKAKKDN